MATDNYRWWMLIEGVVGVVTLWMGSAVDALTVPTFEMAAHDG